MDLLGDVGNADQLTSGACDVATYLGDLYIYFRFVIFFLLQLLSIM